jgi:hypothetical protein
MRWFSNLLKKGEIPMGNIGVFGHLVEMPSEGFADQNESGFEKRDDEFKSGLRSKALPASAEPEIAEESMAGRQAPSKISTGKKEQAGEPPAEGPKDLVAPTVRKTFADTAFWAANVVTDDAGIAEVEFKMPENLTGWKVKVWAMGHGTRVGEGSADVVTRKDLIVRLQAPRFFIETDEVVLSSTII